MRILIADKLSDATRARLEQNGFEVVFEAGLDGPSLSDALRRHRPEVLVVRSTRVGAEQLQAAPSLQLVVRAGAGVNTIDLSAASARGIFVTNCPGMNAAAVAELTLGHILNADRQIADNVADLRAGQWRKKVWSKQQGVKGRTLGVIGSGSIATEVIARARAFGMRIVAWSPTLELVRASALGADLGASVLDVARRCDVLTVHVALTEKTRGMIDEEVLAALRPGAIFVNTSRGEIVDETALARAVTEKGIRAGLDVFANEPAADGAWHNPLADLAGVYGTHHIGASTEQAQEAVAAEACRIIETFRRTGEVPNCVNLAVVTPATHLLVVRHLDRVGVLAGTLARLREAGLNVQGMQNVIFTGDEGAACARIQVEGAPTETLLQTLRDDEAIIEVQVVTL